MLCQVSGICNEGGNSKVFLLAEREELTCPGYKQRHLFLRTQSRSHHRLVGGGAIVGECLVRVVATVKKSEPFYTSMDLCNKYESHPLYAGLSCCWFFFVHVTVLWGKSCNKLSGRQSMNTSLSSLACWVLSGSGMMEDMFVPEVLFILFYWVRPHFETLACLDLTEIHMSVPPKCRNLRCEPPRSAFISGFHSP